MNAVNRLLTAIAARRDLAFLGLLITTIGVMIVPVPPSVLDVLIALNLTLTVTVLLVAVYLDRATSFSTFPAVILMATTFRLAIAISTTRSILTLADGGEIVGTFGHFATGGNVAIGLVVFLIISIVQFVVVTKGAERVAEVAARFTLDALPGRQMSIDAELRSGTIDQNEARQRRQQIDKENQFFGAMDGAMKFVKGDAITGLLIVAVNLVGGLVVGIVQGKMSLGDAASTYSLLTIGDGLVSQLPALIIAMSAGIIITRVTTAESGVDLGSDIADELSRSNRGLIAVGVVVAALGLVPGFPSLIFFAFGAAVLGLAVLAGRRRASAARIADADAEDLDIEPAHGDRIVVRLGTALHATIAATTFVSVQKRARAEFEERMGLALPRFGLLADAGLAPDGVTIEIDGVPLTEAVLPVGQVAALADPAVLDLAGIAHGAAGVFAAGRDHVHLVERDRVEELDRTGIAHVGPETLIVELVHRVAAGRAASFIGFDFVQAQLRGLRNDHPELADQVSATVAVARILDVFRRLASEGVPLRPIRTVFEAIVEWSPRQPDPDVLTEYVRRAVAAQICFVHADSRRAIAGYVSAPDFEQSLRGSLRQTEMGDVLAMPPTQADHLLAQVGEIRKPLDPTAPRPVIVASADLRRHLRAYLAEHDIDLAVLSLGEITREFSVHPVGALLPPETTTRPQLVA